MIQDRMYTLVGILVIGAIALLMLGATYFYRAYYQQKMETYVMFFNGSLEGLEARSIITYRGVKIGEVTKIEITENPVNNTVEVPVYVQFFVERTIGFQHNPVKLLIDQGYVADISKPNLITGVASIQLIESGTPVRTQRKFYREYPIFPTTLIVEKHTSVDETLKEARKALEDIREFIKSREVTETIQSIKDMTRSIDKLASNLNQNVNPLISYLNQSLEQISKAAYATENFMDYLSRYPESLLRGRV
ncbi:MlaD family protein [Legionella londiniensis]|uniref:Putative transmembrane protein n=1 Tax=Legionella londiniensis TaxID=45068 RepID=A0A0W0VMZ5_9GAMM|nr:MlaD family protein [Legionella londiniensis]KTD21190.1 putative transmembrane protein [Legionella londiniensis]STX93214.1 putative transmembrane protein [Legionella londiniensis]